MDFVVFALGLFIVLSSVVLAFTISQVLTVFFRWADARWGDDWGKRPLLLRIPSPVLSAVVVVCFLSLVL